MPLGPVFLQASGSSRIRFPAPLGSTGVSRFLATTGAVTPRGVRCSLDARSGRSVPRGLPDSLTPTSRHSVFNHQRPVRGSPGCQQVFPAQTDFATSLEGSSTALPTESSSRWGPTMVPHVTDWRFSFHCSPPCVATTQLRFDTSRLLTARKGTFTPQSVCLLRRTSGNVPVALPAPSQGDEDVATPFLFSHGIRVKMRPIHPGIETAA